MPNDDIKLQSYQDDFTTDDNTTDPVMDEENDNPAEELGIPEDEFKSELDKQDLGDHTEIGDEDQREYVEDQFDDNDTDARTGTV